MWSRFRADAAFYPYYEYYSESLATLDLAAISHSARDWNSHHPHEAPYFLEFAPLLEPGGGVRGYDAAMAYGHFFGRPADAPGLLAQRAYIAGLIETARGLDRIPVLTCTRGLGRIAWAKQAFGGLHIVLRRPLFHQWCSYSNQASGGNPYFLGTVLDTIAANGDDPVMAVLQRFARDNAVRHGGDASPPSADDDLFICFIVLHIYLDHIAARDADLMLDLAGLADGRAVAAAEEAVHAHCGVAIDLSGARERISLPERLFADPQRIDMMVKSIFLMARNASLVDKALSAHADLAMAAVWADYERYRFHSGGAHAEIARLRAEQSSREIGQARALEQERAVAAAAIADATGYARSLEAARDEAGEQHDRLAARLEAALADADHARAAQAEAARAEAGAARLVADRDALVARLAADNAAMQARLVDVERAMAGERAALHAAVTAAIEQTAQLRAHYDALTAERDVALSARAAADGEARAARDAVMRLEGDLADARDALATSEAARAADRLDEARRQLADQTALAERSTAPGEVDRQCVAAIEAALVEARRMHAPAGSEEGQDFSARWSKMIASLR